jgi:outer membrane protein
MSHRILVPLALASLALATPALARQAGDWTFSVGAHVVAPKSGNGSLAGGALDADVGDDWRPTVTAEYFLTDRMGVEVLAALPFEHDIELNGVRAGSTKHLPPTVTLQYHFRNDSRVTPFLGAGVNYTRFFDEKTTGPLAGTELSLGTSWGLAAHAGVDIAIADDRWIRLDARYLDIDSTVKVDGVRVGTVAIDPTVYGAAFVWSF